jgi:hypothetical protein
MTNRREFLQTGVAVSALPLTMNGLLATQGSVSRMGQSNATLHKAIFDGRYAEGRGFAEAVSRFRVPVHALENGDVTELWCELDLLWRRQPAAIAGFTQFGPMFALERLANERGMRVALRVEHQVSEDGTLIHVMSGPPETMALAEQLSAERMAWPTTSAALVASCSANCAAPVRGTIVTAGARPLLERAADSAVPESVIHYYTPRAVQEGHGVPFDGPLFSWVIAPG